MKIKVYSPSGNYLKSFYQLNQAIKFIKSQKEQGFFKVIIVNENCFFVNREGKIK